jgi:hypothetical protein
MEVPGTNPFRKAGITLLIVGIIDISIMIFCVIKQMDYSSSFNIFAVVAGLFLIRGGVKTARAVRWFSAFYASAFIVILLGFPAMTPPDLLAIQFREHAVFWIISLLVAIALMAVLIWIHRELSTPAALARLSAAGYPTGKPKSAYSAGIALPVLILLASTWLNNSESALRAKALAQEQLGQRYKYHVTRMNISGQGGSATVTAYDANETREVTVNW